MIPSMTSLISLVALNLLLTGAAAAVPGTSDDMEYPTVWSAENLSPSSVSLSCVGEASGLGLLTDFSAVQLGAGEQDSFQWGGLYYNDGLGLNSARWTCRDDISGTVFPEFATGWGERVRLVVKKVDGRLMLAKD